jgi:hypothetical protein
MSGMGATTRGGDDDDGGREERRRFGGKRLSADLEGDRAYIEPPTFCHWSYTKPWQKALLSRVVLWLETKDHSFFTGGLTTRDKRGITRGMP